MNIIENDQEIKALWYLARAIPHKEKCAVEYFKELTLDYDCVGGKTMI